MTTSGMIYFRRTGKQCFITGNTFPMRSLIQRFGGSWQPGRRRWRVSLPDSYALEKNWMKKPTRPLTCKL